MWIQKGIEKGGFFNKKGTQMRPEGVKLGAPENGAAVLSF